MTDIADVATGDGGADSVVPPAGGRDSDERSSWVRSELLLALELLALTAFAFGRPILDTFGRSPETFVARGASRPIDLVLFALAVTLLPFGAVLLPGLVARAGGSRTRGAVHVALVAALGALVAWSVGKELTGWSGSATKLILAASCAGLVIGFLRSRFRAMGSFLRFAGVASLAFPLLFLVASPSATLMQGGRPVVDRHAARAVAAALGDDPPPVVFVLADAFPTQGLLDGGGHIDADLYPNIADLAARSTWYRNSTSVSGFTIEALPAILSGNYPEPGPEPHFAAPHPRNLFTLLAGNYDLHVHEQVTRLCPDEACPDREGAGFGALVGDAVDLWATGSEATDAELDVPGLLESDRDRRFAEWIEEQDFRRGSRPDLFFYHLMLPHEPFDYLDDGTVYAASHPPVGIFSTNGIWSGGVEVGRQRFVLQAQATDRLLGRLFDRLRAAGTYDDALIVFAADHGMAFEADESWRWASPAQYDEIMWAPLIIKSPGQNRAAVNDDNVQTIDILPTIGQELGVELPWDVDGLPASQAGSRDPTVKYLDDDALNELRSDGGEPLVGVDARAGLVKTLAADPVEGSGPHAAWKRTAHGELLGAQIGDLPVLRPSKVEITMDGMARFDDIDRDDPLKLEVVGQAQQALEPGTVVAFGLNGTIAATTEVEPGALGVVFVQALLYPPTFVDGRNELTAYVVEGSPGAEVLHPVAVVGD